MPVAILLLIGLAGLFASLAAFGVSYGMLQAWEATFGALLQWMHDHLRLKIHKSRFVHFTIDFGSVFGSANNYVVTALQKSVAATEKSAGLFLHGMAASVTWTLSTIEDAISDGARWARWSQDVFVPGLIHAATHPLATAVHALRVTSRQTVHTTHVVTRIVHELPKRIEHTTVRVVRQAVPVVIPGIAALPGLVAGWRGLTRRLARLERRMRKAEALVGAAAFAAAMANVLGIGSARCLRDGNLGRVARRLCGLDRGLLDLLMLDLVAVLGVVSVVEFAKDLLVIEDEAVKILGSLIAEFPEA